MKQITLREWQSRAVEKALHWFLKVKTHRQFLVDVAPGAGKTICASVIAQRLLEKEAINRIIVIAPRAEVVRQWAEEFEYVTGRSMMKVTGTDPDIAGEGLDLCATWAALQNLKEGFQEVCRSHQTLIICDEHHHAAVEAAWGSGADNSFEKAKYILVLSGTPVRSDGRRTTWFALNQMGQIEHPEEGVYTLTYGEAVNLGYCRPITFHRHEGKFDVMLSGGEGIAVSGTTGPQVTPVQKKKLKGLQEALNFYKLACALRYQSDGKTPDPYSYQATMLEWGISKLDDLRQIMPQAGGLVIAPSIEHAEYMAKLLEQMDGEKPSLVHSQSQNSEQKISIFRKRQAQGWKRWIVSVGMISEGVDIKRLRVLIYLPNAQTELSFRQAMGRVVRTLGEEDFSRAYVVMPAYKIFEEYARRVESELPTRHREDRLQQDFKICPVCEAKNDRKAEFCKSCEHKFVIPKPRLKPCPECKRENPLGCKECQFCGYSFQREQEYKVTLKEALRVGAIIRELDVTEEEALEGERIAPDVKKAVFESGDAALVNVLRTVPDEALSRLSAILEKARDRDKSE